MAGPDDPNGPKPWYTDRNLPREGRMRAYHPTLHTEGYMDFVGDYLGSAVKENLNCDVGEAKTQMEGLYQLLRMNRLSYGGAGAPLPDGED